MHEIFSNNSNMSDNEIEEVSFLPGDSSSHKKSVYEPTIFQKCCRIICIQKKVVMVTVVVGVIIILTALIASFARPTDCTSQNLPISQSAHDTSTIKSTTQPYLSTNGKSFPWHDIRLPKTVIPLTYELFLHPNISKSVVWGSVKIIAEVKSPTDFIVLHLKDLNVSAHFVHSLDSSGTSPRSGNLAQELLFYEENEQVYIGLSKKLAVNEKIQIEIAFNGSLEMKLSGFYKSEYKTKAGEKRHIATTHFEPTYARFAFPCFDEPNLKAKFTLSIVRDPDHITLHNTMIKNSTKYQDNLILDSYEQTVKMSTYLLAFIVCDYGNVTRKTTSGTPVRVFAPKDQIKQIEFAAEAGAKILEYYEKFFNIKYPLKKQDLIGVPDFSAGAMENWGLIIFRMSALLYDPVVSSSRDQQWVSTVIAHELAHQWFGNLVTMKWWDDLWLNEGFADFVEYIGSDFVNPKWKMNEQFVSESLMRALMLDSLSNSHPIKVTVSNPHQIDEIFDAVSYNKGSSVLKMLQNFIGNDTFSQGVTHYLKTFAYSNAESSDLWKSLSAVVPKGKQLNVENIMNTWVNQMGYPVVTVKRQNSEVILTQQRFLLNPEAVRVKAPKSPYNYKWYVPFYYVTSSEPKNEKVVWMNMTDAKIVLPENTKWLKGNYGSFGVYRVNYDDRMWKEITEQLNSDHTIFSPEDKALLIDDVFKLSRSGNVEVKIAFDLSTYLSKEKEYIAWDTAINNLVYIEKRLYSKEIFTEYKAYILTLMQPLLKQLGFKDEGDYFTKSLRQIILNTAIRLGEPKTVEKGRLIFKDWMNHNKSIPRDLKTAVFRAGVEYGTEEEWQFCWKHYQSTVVASEKNQMLGALARTKKTRLLSLYLESSLNPNKIKEQDAISVINAVHRNPAGALLSWRFVKSNWKTIGQKVSDGVFSSRRLVKGVTSSFSTEYDFKDVKDFFQDKETISESRSFKQALEYIRMNINWMKKQEQGATDWLSKKMMSVGG